MKWNLKNLYESCRTDFFSPENLKNSIFCVLLPVGSNQSGLEGLSADKQTAVQQRSTTLKPSEQVSDQSVPKQQQKSWWVFSSSGAGSSCFPFTVTGQTPTFIRHSTIFLPWRLSENICLWARVQNTILGDWVQKKGFCPGYFLCVCLWEWETRAAAQENVSLAPVRRRSYLCSSGPLTS